MKKKLLVSLIGCMLTFSLVGCNSTVNVNVENEEKISSNNLGEFITIGSVNGDTLKYDTATRIVYFDGYYTFTPYYALNGLPYRYNPETNTFEEIKFGEE